jgi:uncharacterized protein (TIGR03382 family)
MTSTFLRRCVVPLAFASLVARTAGAQTTTTSTGTVPITLTQSNYSNLSLYDCENNGSTQVTFSFSYAWVSGQVAEYFLSTDQTCVPPEGSAINEGGTDGQSATSARIESLNPLSEPSDGTTTDSDDTTNLTFAGIWNYYAQAMNDASGVSVLEYNAAPTTPNCPTGVDMQAVYLCVLIQVPATGTTGLTYVSGALAFNLDSDPPAAPDAPTVTSLDSELEVSWNSVTTPIQAAYYTVHVAVATSIVDGGVILDAGVLPDGGGLPTSIQSDTVSTETSTKVTGLTNGVTYDVWVVATDSAGSSPPTTANTSGPSSIVQGVPIPSIGYFQAYKMDGGAENGGCASGGGVAAAVLVLALLLLWRRRRVAAILLAATLLGGTARAEDDDKADDAPTDIGTPVVRKASPEWFRVDVMTGPFYPNPDNEKGLTGKPYEQIFHPKGAPLPNALLTKVEFHVNFLKTLGHLSLGVGIGVWQAQGHSLNLTESGTTSDQEALTLYPLSLILGWRMDFIYTRYGVPIVPVLKLGYGGVYFTDTKNGNLTYGVSNGVRWDSWGLAGGPEGAIGIEFPLDFLDPRRAANLDEDLGINSTGIFAEAAYNYYKGFNGGLNLSGPVYSGGLYIAF